MSSTSIGKVASFPPLPGQPFPPARNHPRWKEIYRLHDEWIMKYWPFKSARKKARIPFMNLAGFSTWCAPAADFKRMVWGARIAGIFFLADDLVDTGKMLDRIPGFKKAATGEGPLNPADRAEICHDIVFRAIKATCHPRTFQQLTRCTHEWWDSNIHGPYKNLDQYLAIRRVNIAMYFANAYFRYTLDINLTDAQVNHPLMREAEGIVADHVGLTNDFFSYAKEKMTNSDDTNILRILQEQDGLTYSEAAELIKQKIRQKELDFIPAGVAVLDDPQLGQDPEVRRWIACLPYCMSGNLAWSQESGRYNVGHLPDGIDFPCIAYHLESTPSDELVDDSSETKLRNDIFSVKDIPAPDFSIDADPIETDLAHLSTMYSPIKAQAQGAGIIGIETYRRPFSYSRHPEDVREAALDICTKAVSSLLRKFKIDPSAIGRFNFVSNDALLGTSASDLVLRIVQLFSNDLEIVDSSNDSVTALLNSINWIECRAWDGRNSIICAVEKTENSIGTVAVLIGAHAPIILEPIRGRFTGNILCAPSMTNVELSQFYFKSLDEAYSSYKVNLSKHAPRTSGPWWNPEGQTVSSEFDFMIYDRQVVSEVAHARIFNDYVSHPWIRAFECIPTPMQTLRPDAAFLSQPVVDMFLNLSAEDHHQRVKPATVQDSELSATRPFIELMSLFKRVPGYELFEKRIAIFSCNPRGTSFFCVLRIKGDTDILLDDSL